MKALALPKPIQPISARDIFRAKFQRSLRECLRYGFAVEESFGLVWEETLDEICLLDHEKVGLYDDLISWARSLPGKRYSPIIHRVYSQRFRVKSSKPLAETHRPA